MKEETKKALDARFGQKRQEKPRSPILPKLYTVEEIAEILRMKDPRSAANLLRRKGIGRRIGKRRYVTEKELQKLLEGETPEE